jgi:hypothetical protein
LEVVAAPAQRRARLLRFLQDEAARIRGGGGEIAGLRPKPESVQRHQRGSRVGAEGHCVPHGANERFERCGLLKPRFS